MGNPLAKPSFQDLVADMLARLQAGGTLTDTNPGSVIRTLVEAFGLQLALTYEQLATIYDAGFIDTATGGSLDHLVALVGQQRNAGQQAVGEATFRRDPRVVGQVMIPAGTTLKIALARLPDQPVVYTTRRDASLGVGQDAGTVEIFASVPNNAPSESVLLLPNEVPASPTLSTLVAGIGEVVIAQPTTIRGQDESDADLRGRVKRTVAGVGAGTAAALTQAIINSGLVSSVTLHTPSDSPPAGVKVLEPGNLEIVVDLADKVDPDLLDELRGIINAIKAPGIAIQLQQVERFDVSFDITLSPSGTLGPQHRDSTRQSVQQAVLQAVEALQPGEVLRWNPLMAALFQIPGVGEIESVTVTNSRSKEPVVLVDQGVTRIPQYPSGGPAWQYKRIVPATDRRPVNVTLQNEQAILVGVTFASLPDNLYQKLNLSDRVLLTGQLEQQLDLYLRAQNEKTGDRVLLPKDLADKYLYHVFDKWFQDKTVLQIVVVDGTTNAEILLTVDSDPYPVPGIFTLIKSSMGVTVGKWGKDV